MDARMTTEAEKQPRCYHRGYKPERLRCTEENAMCQPHGRRRHMMRRVCALILFIMMLTFMGVYDLTDHRSCVCYRVTDEPQERQIGQEIMSLYEPSEGTMSLTLLTCRHHKRMWLRIVWDQGTYQIWRVDTDP